MKHWSQNKNSHLNPLNIYRVLGALTAASSHPESHNNNKSTNFKDSVMNKQSKAYWSKTKDYKN